MGAAAVDVHQPQGPNHRTPSRHDRTPSGRRARLPHRRDPERRVDRPPSHLEDAREEVASTAAGGGVAFLHPRYHDPYLFQETFLALGRTARPVFFGAQDGTATDLFFLICCTDHTLHLHILARLCLLAHGTPLLENLRAAEDAAAMHAALKAAEDEFLTRA